MRVTETARECLDKAIEIVKPGMLFRDAGNVIEAHAKTKKCSVIKTYCGHGINQLFHCAPNVPHYAKNKAIGQAKVGQCFTIEPMISLGTWRDKTWPDDWTSVTQDGTRTAQFGKFLLSKSASAKVPQHCAYSIRTYVACDRGWCGDSHGKITRFAWRARANARNKRGSYNCSIDSIEVIARERWRRMAWLYRGYKIMESSSMHEAGPPGLTYHTRRRNDAIRDETKQTCKQTVNSLAIFTKFYCCSP